MSEHGDMRQAVDNWANGNRRDAKRVHAVLACYARTRGGSVAAGLRAGYRGPAMNDLSPYASELVLYADNTYELYGQKQATERNLLRKMRRGRYDHAKAPQAWAYWVVAAAKRYYQELGPRMGWDQKGQAAEDGVHYHAWWTMFPPEVRREAAQYLADRFRDEVEAGEHGEVTA